jgi:transcriptional regulator with XRE-family HTH domain
MYQPEAAALRKKMVGVLLKHARLRARLAVKDVAQATGFATRAITDYECGRADLSLPHLEVLAQLYDVPVGYFWAADPLVEDERHPLPAEAAIALRRRIIGVLVCQARSQAGYSQNDLAQWLDCPPARISDYEAGRADIPLLELESLAERVGVPMSYFVDQGIQPGNRLATTVEEVRRLAELPEDVRAFVFGPGSRPYVQLAMQLSTLPGQTLRQLGEHLLEITG